jgi:hypothetical protein
MKCSDPRGFSFTVKTNSKADDVPFKIDAEKLCEEIAAFSEHVLVSTSRHAPIIRRAGFCFEVQPGRKISCQLHLFLSGNSRKYWNISL